MPLRLRVLPPEREASATRVERIVELDGLSGEVRIGRGAGIELQLPFATISTEHARLVREGTAWLVEDLRSTNGTTVDGERLPAGGRRALRPGQRLRLADVEVLFEGELATPTPGAGVLGESTASIARRLVADLFQVASGTAVPRVVVEEGGGADRVLELTRVDNVYVVGRGETCDLSLTDTMASREHARLIRRGDGVYLEDLGSTNGVLLRGERLVGGIRRLRDGDVIRIGGTVLRFEDPEDRYLRDMESRVDVEAVPPAASAHTPQPEAAVVPAGPSASVGPVVAVAALALAAVAAVAAWLFLGG